MNNDVQKTVNPRLPPKSKIGQNKQIELNRRNLQGIATNGELQESTH